MPGKSFSVNPMHIVFSTKHRQPFIKPPVEEKLHAYMAEICNQLECRCVIVGGFTDHVHILCYISKKIPLMKLLEKVKSHSSKWVKTQGKGYENFYWQNGYAAFAVDKYGLRPVTDYIRNQHQHHTKKEFKKEYIDLLTEHDVEFDEKYIWD